MGEESNMLDKAKHGTQRRGEQIWNSKITAGCVSRMRDLSAAKVSQKEMGKWFGVDQSAVSNALSGRNWRHLVGG